MSLTRTGNGIASLSYTWEGNQLIDGKTTCRSWEWMSLARTGNGIASQSCRWEKNQLIGSKTMG